jgi:copper resistance protein C
VRVSHRATFDSGDVASLDEYGRLIPRIGLFALLLVAVDPADGAVLDDAPAEITLTFSGELLGTGAEAAVTTPGGTEPAGVEVDGEVVTLALPEGLPGGDWTVAWRVVSTDGHPMDGSLGYTVAGGAAPPSSPPSPAESARPTDADTSAPAHGHGEPGADLGEYGEANWTMSWLFGVGVLAAVGLAAAVLLHRRRRDAEAGATSVGDPGAPEPGAGADDDPPPGTSRPRS